jgi:hypothetical protein
MIRRIASLLLICAWVAPAQENAGASESPGSQSAPVPAAASAPPETGTAEAPGAARTQLNLLGQTDSRSGESRRNENVQFNLVDNNAQKELNQRIGVTATLITEFTPDRPYFGAEYGPTAPWTILVSPLHGSSQWHGAVRWSHLNSIFSARAFFQVGGVQPARDNNVSASATGRLWRGAYLSLDGSAQANRGMVNGNILAPLPSERTPLATEPRLRAIVQSILSSYPDVAPNRPDIDPRMVNTNAPQRIDNRTASSRLQQDAGRLGVLTLSWSWIAQKVDAFQLVRGQNPNTTTRAHKAGIYWNKTVSPSTVVSAGFRYDRVGTVIAPESEAVPYAVFPSQALTTINGNSSIPIDRAQNAFRTAVQIRSSYGRHNWAAGAQLNRHQLNGIDSDSHIPALSFNNTPTADAITNLRLGTPITYFQAIGYLPRGFRYWDNYLYFTDTVRVSSRLTASLGLGYRPLSRPVEVNNLNMLPYSTDWNNFGPTVSLAYRPAKLSGVIRAAYGLHYGEIFPVTFQQVRFNQPLNRKLVIQGASLVDPLADYDPDDPNSARPVTYDFAPDLVSPYAHLYSASWGIPIGQLLNWEIGYVGSRSLKLLYHNYTNRARILPGIPITNATVDLRRADPNRGEIRRVENMSRGYYDAFRTTLVTRYKGLQADFSYWFSKAIDLGGDYTGTAHDLDSFRNRSQSEFAVFEEMKARSRFDQPHALLLRADYSLPRSRRLPWMGTWNLFGVGLAKSGTPFQVTSGSDAPGYGNVDGVSLDRPDVLDPSVLGRSITHPDISRRLLPRSAFRFITPGMLRGNLGRNTFRRAPIRNLNAGLSARWIEGAARSIEFRAESNNLTNTPQFAEPGWALSDQNFGVITNTLNDGRSFRLSLRLGF